LSYSSAHTHTQLKKNTRKKEAKYDKCLGGADEDDELNIFMGILYGVESRRIQCIDEVIS
jgi:hypothetical protein